MKSLLENYLSTIQNQDLPTKYLQKKELETVEKPQNKKFRCFTNNIEDRGHIISVCFDMSAIDHFPVRHNKVTKTITNSHLKKIYPSKRIILSSELEYIYI